MKKLFLAVVAMMVSAATFAQNEAGQITIQPKVGVNIANITDAVGADPVLVWLPVQNLSMD